MEKKFIIFIIIVTILILGGGIFFVSGSASAPQITASSNAKVSVEQAMNFDWGNISYSGAKATKTFTIKNTGKDTLKLFNIKTSCHCTKAYLTINGQESEKFGMAMGDTASAYVGQVEPGKEATLTVLFDQSFHGPSGMGPVTRYISVDTNDSQHPTLTFTLTGVVVQ